MRTTPSCTRRSAAPAFTRLSPHCHAAVACRSQTRAHASRPASRPERGAAARSAAAARTHGLDLRPAPGHAGLPGAAAARLPAPCRMRHAVPGGRHHRRLAAAPPVVLAAGAQRRGAEAAAHGAQGHEGDLRARQPRRVRAALRAAQLRRRRRGRRLDPRNRRRPQAVGDPRRPVRRRDPVRALAGPCRRLGLRTHAAPEPAPELAARAPGPAVLEPVALPEAEGQARGQLRRRLRAGGRARGAQAWRAGRRLRPHPPCRAARHRRHPVCQRRRLGREPDRAGRTCRRPAGDHRLGPARGRAEGRPWPKCRWRWWPEAAKVKSGWRWASAAAPGSAPLRAAGKPCRPAGHGGGAGRSRAATPPRSARRHTSPGRSTRCA